MAAFLLLLDIPMLAASLRTTRPGTYSVSFWLFPGPLLEGLNLRQIPNPHVERLSIIFWINDIITDGPLHKPEENDGCKQVSIKSDRPGFVMTHGRHQIECKVSGRDLDRYRNGRDYDPGQWIGLNNGRDRAVVQLICNPEQHVANQSSELEEMHG
ncbi:hypothetical protein [Dyadobacter fermentans]|uniref:hypothetical protein n=1 Tax=Dyadobacter fermentans TaxID=94254 RepID=UPI00117D8AE8|nr:hypothetical protein [Dyadobacter fermentans]